VYVQPSNIYIDNTSMQKAPKALRLHIGFFGRTNVGKSSFLNVISGQNVAITSEIAGTTTDVVEKTMEFLPIGPIVILDTAGLDDTSELSEKRLEKTNKVFDRADVVVLICEPNIWTKFEEKIIKEAEQRNIPYIIVVNKSDLNNTTKNSKLKTQNYITGNSINKADAEKFRQDFKQELINILPADFITPPTLLGDLIPNEGSLVIMVIPIDFEAPKGRIILPQVQAIRDVLDNNSISIIVKEHQLAETLTKLNTKPDLVICDSQAIKQVAEDTPTDIPLTTFSIIFARFKGDLVSFVKGVNAIRNLKDGDKVLIAEGCSHHPIEGDIGREKIPAWLREYTGCNLDIDVSAGHDFPDDDYKVIIHCGGCVMNRRAMLNRINQAEQKGIPITNYGVCISLLQGALPRTIEPFDDAFAVYGKHL